MELGELSGPLLREAGQVPRNKARSTRGLALRPMIVVFGLRMRLSTCMASYGASLECHSFPAARRVWPRETTTELGQCCEQVLNWSSFEWSELRAITGLD